LRRRDDGMPFFRPSAALVRAAIARACGLLHTLRLNGAVPFKTLRALAVANAASLRELCADSELDCAEVAALLHVAPSLRVLETAVKCHGVEEVHAARALLRGEGLPDPRCSVRLSSLYCWRGADDDQSDFDVDECIGLAADLAAHGWTRRLHFYFVDLDAHAALDAIVDAALACRMTDVELDDCLLSPASVPALARLLRGNALAALGVYNSVLDNPLQDDRQLLDVDAAVLLRDALQANISLTSLSLICVMLWLDPTAVALLFGALTGHPRLRVLDVDWNYTLYDSDVQRTAGEALAALLYANAPALQQLKCSDCALGDVGLAPLFAALPHATHLRELNCSTNGVSASFARDVLLPAVRANSSLLYLKADDDIYDDEEHEDQPFIEEAEALVADRAAAQEDEW
jgi:hypothetical protein